jgi:hypothetical protein
MGAGMAQRKGRGTGQGAVPGALLATSGGADAVDPLVTTRGGRGSAAATRPPVVKSRRSRPSVETSIVPSRSVRATRAPAEPSRSMVSGAGCP